jgi:hypothetical protein
MSDGKHDQSIQYWVLDTGDLHYTHGVYCYRFDQTTGKCVHKRLVASFTSSLQALRYLKRIQQVSLPWKEEAESWPTRSGR